MDFGTQNPTIWVLGPSGLIGVKVLGVGGSLFWVWGLGSIATLLGRSFRVIKVRPYSPMGYGSRLHMRASGNWRILRRRIRTRSLSSLLIIQLMIKKDCITHNAIIPIV